MSDFKLEFDIENEYGVDKECQVDFRRSIQDLGLVTWALFILETLLS